MATNALYESLNHSLQRLKSLAVPESKHITLIGHYLRGQPFVVVSETILDIIKCTHSTIMHHNNKRTTNVHSMAREYP